MLIFPPSVRMILCLTPTDMRKSFDGLARIVEEVCREDPFSGHLFVFCNRQRDRAKILYWDRDGYALWYKRLEEGAFRFPTCNSESMEMSSENLWALLSGIDFSTAKRSRRYKRK
jgi:transposase